MRLLRQRIPAIGMNTECKYHHKSRAASVEILDETTKILDYHLVSYPGTRGEFPCWTPGRHKRGILLLDAETTKQVPRLSLGVIPRHQRGFPCWTPERHQRGIDNCISSCGISLGFSCFSQLGSHGLFDSPARLRNETKSFVDHLESHTVLACNSNQDNELEVGRKGMDGYLLV